jgi:hypothetical protein
MNLRLGLPQALAVSLFAHAALVAPWPGMAPDVASEVVRVQPITVRLARAPQAPPAPEQREQALPPASTGEAPAPEQHPAQIAGDSAAPAATPVGTPQRARRSELAANELPDNILIDTTSPHRLSGSRARGRHRRRTAGDLQPRPARQRAGCTARQALRPPGTR